MQNTITTVMTKEQAERVIAFLSSADAFELEMTPFRIQARKEAVLSSISNLHHRFWFIENEVKKVIGAVGICENERGNGGYYLDYFAVHKKYRKQKIGTRLLKKSETFVSSLHGRFILVDTGDTKDFEPARRFYEKNGYIQVGHIPEYYDVGDGRIDYYKKL